jgi:mRNA interferase MazF
MRIKSGTVVLVNFPFTDLQSSKVRPAIAFTQKGDDVMIVGIFSKVPEDLQDSWIRLDEGGSGFKQTGLRKASVIKTEKIAVVHQSLIRKELGRLSPELIQKVKQILRRTLGIE